MNVKEIRQRIYDQMDFNPDIQQYRDSVVRRINDHYQRISDSAHWLFLQKETDLQLRKNITGSSSVTFQVSGSNARLIQVTGSSTLKFTLEMEGQILVDENGIEFVIVRVEAPDKAFIEPLEFSNIDSLEDPSMFWGGSLNTDITSFTIRFDRFRLPRNCIEVLGVID